MREIKYRQPYFLSNGKFSHWHYWGWISDGEFIGPLSMGQTKDRGQQFLGRLDKNGKEIYEGDILLADTSWGDKKYVGVRYDGNMVAETYTATGTHGYLHTCLNDHDATYEIIGNIYETPELLEE